MFSYEDGNDFGRMWRPDLVTHILRWLDTIPSESRQHLIKLKVSDIGGFVAIFRIEDSPEVYFEFDDDECFTIRVPEYGWFCLCGEILPFEQKHLTLAISGHLTRGATL